MTNKDLLKDDDKIDFRAIISTWVRYWWVFLICLAGCLGLAALYLSIKSPTWAVQGSVILNQDEEQKGSLGGSLGSLMQTFSLGGGGSKNVEDELYRMQSHSNLSEVVRRTGINFGYYSKDNFFARKKWYYNDSPIVVSLPEAVVDTVGTTVIKMNVPADGKNIKVNVKQRGEKVLSKTYPSFPFMVKTPSGSFYVTTTDKYIKGEAINFVATISAPGVKAEDLNDKILTKMRNKKSNIIQLSIEEVRPDRGSDILQTIIDVYNDRTLSETQEKAQSSVSFIEERLLTLYNDLQDNENKIEDYKRRNQIVDAQAEAEYIFKKKETVEGKIVEVETKISVLKMIIDFLHSDANRYSLIPFTQDIPEDPISAYNEVVLERLKLEANPKGNAAAIKSLSTQLDAMRANLLTTLDRELAAAKIAERDLNRVAGTSKDRMEGIPTMERELLGLYRDQKIQNTIYAFLLQKREEAQMQAMRNVKPGKIVDEAYVGTEPAAPNKPVILIGAFLIGIIVPAFGLYCFMLWKRHELRQREEEEEMK